MFLVVIVYYGLSRMEDVPILVLLLMMKHVLDLGIVYVKMLGKERIETHG